MAAGEEITFDLTEPYIMPADADVMCCNSKLGTMMTSI